MGWKDLNSKCLYLNTRMCQMSYKLFTFSILIRVTIHLFGLSFTMIYD